MAPWFNKLYRKVFDVDIAPSKDFTVSIWNQWMGKEVETTLGLGNTFTLRAVPSSRLIGMIEAYDLDKDVQLVDWKDKLGNPAKIRPWDFEDSLVKELHWKFISFKVRWTWIDTRYIFKEGDEFKLEEPKVSGDLTIEDTPF